jgi:hypothetical protein
VGAYGYVLSCLVFNDHVDRGCQLPGRLLRIRGSWVRPPGSRVCADPRQKDELNWADRWRDPARP